MKNGICLQRKAISALRGDGTKWKIKWPCPGKEECWNGHLWRTFMSVYLQVAWQWGKLSALSRFYLLGKRRLLLSHFSCVRLCDPIDGSPPGFPIPGILQARTLEWVAISFSNAWKWKVKVLSRVRLFATPWTAAYQAPPSMGFARQEYWSGVPLLSPRGGC